MLTTELYWSRSLLEAVDQLSRKLNKLIDKVCEPFLATIREGNRVLLEQNPTMKAQLEAEGLTMEQFLDNQNDMPFSEGSSNIRNFMAQGACVHLDKVIPQVGAEGVRRALQPTWFEHGKFSRLDPTTRRLVQEMAARPSLPTLLFREQEGRLDVKIGDHFDLPEPESWSMNDKSMMGETTLKVRARHGTAVSCLSQYMGEAEVISRAPKGYTVVTIEDRMWGKMKSRRVVTLEEVR